MKNAESKTTCESCKLHREDWEKHAAWIRNQKAGWAFMLLRDEKDRLELNIERLTRLIHMILYADERGQGINFHEAMTAAARETHYNEI